MATRPDTLSPFIAKLLAPLPGEAEQVSDNAFLRLTKEDMKSAWFGSMRHVGLAKAHLDFVRAERLLAEELSPARRNDLRAKEDRAFAAYVEQVDRQMQVPAPLKEMLAWKRRHVRIGATSEIIAARGALIARDAAWLGGGL